MLKNYEYTTKEERAQIITSEELPLVKEANVTEGNFLYFGELEPNHPSEMDSLREEDRVLQLALAESIEKQEIDKVNNQIALAELVETLISKGVL